MNRQVDTKSTIQIRIDRYIGQALKMLAVANKTSIKCLVEEAVAEQYSITNAQQNIDELILTKGKPHAK